MNNQSSIKSKFNKNTLIEKYEDLRNNATDSTRNVSIKSQGFALFLHQGMIGWLEAWYKVGEEAQPFVRKKTESINNEEDNDMNLNTQITALITNIILGILEGGKRKCLVNSFKK